MCEWVKRQMHRARTWISCQPARHQQVDALEARCQAVAWWSAQDREPARCDVCCTELPWGEGYLLQSWQVPDSWMADDLLSEDDQSAWLVCRACFQEFLPAKPLGM